MRDNRKHSLSRIDHSPGAQMTGDLFNQAGLSQPGERQTDIEELIAETHRVQCNQCADRGYYYAGVEPPFMKVDCHKCKQERKTQ